MSAFLYCLISFFLFWKADFFSLDRITVPLIEAADPESEPISWPKTFRYLGKGRQSFVFQSGPYVLKFFIREQLELPWYSDIPLPFIQKKRLRHEKKIRIYPDSYRLAFEHLRSETGLLAIHLGHSQSWPTVELIDGSGKSLRLNLNDVPFILQKRGTPLTLTQENYTHFLSQYLGLHKKRLALSIGDYDRDLKHNYCWDGDHLLYIDPGRLYYDPTLNQENEWKRVMHPLKKNNLL